jgi:hypothetical protein
VDRGVAQFLNVGSVFIYYVTDLSFKSSLFCREEVFHLPPILGLHLYRMNQLISTMWTFLLIQQRYYSFIEYDQMKVLSTLFGFNHSRVQSTLSSESLCVTWCMHCLSWILSFFNAFSYPNGTSCNSLTVLFYSVSS